MSSRSVTDRLGLPANWEPRSFDHLRGWDDDDHGVALSVLRRQMPFSARPSVKGPVDRYRAALARLNEPLGGAHLRTDPSAARHMFEDLFVPVGAPDERGQNAFYTGYFEPVAAASRTRTKRFSVPLYRVPDDLVKVTDANRPPGWNPAIPFGRRTESGLGPYADRREIELGYLAGRGLELAFVESAVEAFFIHIQGSACLQFADGSRMRISYAAKSGHAYTSIGKILVDNGTFAREDLDMARLRAWLVADEARGRELMWHNRSFIFFHETPDLFDGPIGAAGVPLVPERSLAVDKSRYAFGLPVWVEADLPTAEDGGVRPFRKLMIAQDTGSAIVGPERGDIFFAHGSVAGRIRHPGRFVVLVPRILFEDAGDDG